MEKHGPEITYREGLAALLNDPGVDGIIVHLFAGFGVWFLDMKKILAEVSGPRKPVLFWLLGHEQGFHPTRLASVDRATVRGMAEGLKGRALLQGYRGAAPVKMDLLAEWLIRLGELACQVEAIQEIDVNPLLLVRGEPIAVDTSIILR